LLISWPAALPPVALVLHLTATKTSVIFDVP
jgi:hypothetical protein